MPVYYGSSSCYPSPFVVARYACRCGRMHTRHGAVRVSKVPPGWYVTSDLAGQPEPECARCHKETVASDRAAQKRHSGRHPFGTHTSENRL